MSVRTILPILFVFLPFQFSSGTFQGLWEEAPDLLTGSDPGLCWWFPSQLHRTCFSCSFVFICRLFFFNVFIYFWLRWVFVATRGLSLVAVSGGLLFFEVRGLLVVVASLVVEHGL